MRTTNAPLALFSLLTLAALAGCQMRGDVRPLTSEVPPPPRFVDINTGCNASEARFALGQRVTTPVLESIRERASADTAITSKPGDLAKPAVAKRIIVDVDEAGNMVGARCG